MTCKACMKKSTVIHTTLTADEERREGGADGEGWEGRGADGEGWEGQRGKDGRGKRGKSRSGKGEGWERQRGGRGGREV